MTPEPGDVWLADLGLAAKTRPVVIVSRKDSNPPRALVRKLGTVPNDVLRNHKPALAFAWRILPFSTLRIGLGYFSNRALAFRPHAGIKYSYYDPRPFTSCYSNRRANPPRAASAIRTRSRSRNRTRHIPV